jgi:uncharacterized protein (DUF2225 family)
LKNSNPDFPLPLSTKQQDALSLLEDSIRNIENYKKWVELSFEEIDRIIREDENYKRLRKQHLKDLSKAISLDLIWHPLVYEFINTYKNVGNKEIIRKIKRGWEKNVKRPIKIKDIGFMLYLDKIVEHRYAGKTWKEIRRDLMKRKIIGKISLQGIEKKIKKTWHDKWEKTGRKAPPLR